MHGKRSVYWFICYIKSAHQSLKVDQLSWLVYNCQEHLGVALRHCDETLMLVMWSQHTHTHMHNCTHTHTTQLSTHKYTHTHTHTSFSGYIYSKLTSHTCNKNQVVLNWLSQLHSSICTIWHGRKLIYNLTSTLTIHIHTYIYVFTIRWVVFVIIGICCIYTLSMHCIWLFTYVCSAL